MADSTWIASPYLNLFEHAILNPHTGRGLGAEHPWYPELRVSLEAHSVCNQRCFFCPVSVAPRDPYYMPTSLYERIISEIADLGEPIEAVAMIQYNEPTADRRFVEQVRMIKATGLPPAVLSNGSALTPDKVDALVAMGGISYFSVNLSTLDREQYPSIQGQR